MQCISSAYTEYKHVTVGAMCLQRLHRIWTRHSRCNVSPVPTQNMNRSQSLQCISSAYTEYKHITVGAMYLRRRGRVSKGMGHLPHVWSLGVRKVVSSIPGRGNIVGWVFHPTRWLARFSLIWICLSFQILNLFRTLSSWWSDNYRPSAPFLYEVASHVK